MPVVEVDRDPVEVRDATAFCRVALLQLLQLERHVGDGRVDLAGQEEALAVRPQELRELRPALRDELEHDEERNDAGVRLREVAEVVVRRDLAGEDGVLGAHALLDERVADAIHERRPAGPLDRLGNGPARAHVVDDLLAGRLREHGLGEERGHEVAGDELARVVDEEAAVGVAVVRDAEVCSLLARPSRR